jgi:hypothetical protein
MGIPTSEVGYTSATTGREIMKSMMGLWGNWIKKKMQKYSAVSIVYCWTPFKELCELGIKIYLF